MGIDVHRGTGFCVAHSGLNGFDVLITGNQKRCGSMSQAVEGNERQLFFLRLALIESLKGLLKDLVWRGVIH